MGDPLLLVSGGLPLQFCRGLQRPRAGQTTGVSMPHHGTLPGIESLSIYHMGDTRGWAVIGGWGKTIPHC